MRRARSCERDDGIGSAVRSGLRRVGISDCTGRNIDGQHGSSGLVDSFNGSSDEARDWRCESSAENGIDDEVCITDGSREFVLKITLTANNDRTDRQASEHICGIASELRWIAEEKNFDNAPRLMQFASHDETIATVISFSANDGDALGVWPFIFSEGRDRRSRALHQGQ